MSKIVKLKEIVDFKTGRLDSNCAEENGTYPFFTCSPETLRINSYAFDCEAVLLAGNNANAVFPVKYYNGKFNAYQRTYIITPKDKSKINVKWLYFQIKHVAFELGIRAVGSATKFLTKRILDDYEINLPNLDAQNYIARALWGLENKIQLNTQINQTLEQIAQALFKSWFVDFDPVRAKVQALSDGLSLEQAELAAMQAISGKTPEELTALSQTQPDRYAELVETAKAFPCEMVVVDGVEVPKGWDTLSFKDFIKEKKEKVGNLKNVPEYSVTNNGIIPRSQKFNKQLSKNPEKNKLLHKTDLVFGMSREVLNWGIMEDEIGAVSSAYHIYSINKDKVNYLYLKMLMQNRFEYFNELIRPSSREGQGFDKELLKEKKVTIPCNILLDKFLHDLNTIKGQMNNITQETESLIFIRNLLLPKLLNGEI
ncbi:restriction endonuclease subunit S [Haemophilus haemolyticus]|uniref:restriction endonuclease subunit S n=1 Tax=Haemophilus haemolyticus TaxID=726 RepID=UPI000E59431B|nr:restriction endonuclease subunit S [Haemophilus haemolyticus]